jgi:hypothetical protein
MAYARTLKMDQKQWFQWTMGHYTCIPEYTSASDPTGSTVFGADMVVLSVVKVLCYKPEGRGFEQEAMNDFYQFAYLSDSKGSGVYSASNRNEYQIVKNVSGK